MQAELVIQSSPPEVRRARDWVSEKAADAGFTDREVSELALVVSEACANVIKHAYHNEPNHPINLKLTIDEVRLVLVMRDFGATFDLANYQPPDLDVPQEGGYGVFIIRSLMDEVDYDVSDQPGTTLRLVKNRRGNEPVSRTQSSERKE